MYSRFRDSLIYPRKIVDFRKDHLVWVLLYVLFFALLLSTRTSIQVFTYDGLSPNTRTIIAREFEDVDDTCKISEGAISCDTSVRKTLYTSGILSYHIDTYDEINYDLYEGNYHIIFHQEQVLFVLQGRAVYQENISNLPVELRTLDFADQANDPEAFYDQLFDGVDAYITSQKGIWAPLLIASEVIGSLLMYFFFIIISAWFMKMRFKRVSFKDLFKMTSYSATALYLILIFDSLFNFSFIFVILLIFIAFRQNNEVSAEITRRLQKK
jgi:hypothetical protein